MIVFLYYNSESIYIWKVCFLQLQIKFSLPNYLSNTSYYTHDSIIFHFSWYVKCYNVTNGNHYFYFFYYHKNELELPIQYICLTIISRSKDCGNKIIELGLLLGDFDHCKEHISSTNVVDQYDRHDIQHLTFSHILITWNFQKANKVMNIPVFD